MGPGFQLFPAIETPHVSLAAEEVFSIGSFIVTNSMLTMFIVMIGLVIFFLFATRRLRSGNREAQLAAPTGAQNFAETCVEYLLGVTESTAGKRLGRQIFPLVATIFIFVLVANYTGLLPGVGTLGQCKVEETTAKVVQAPLAASAASLVVTDTGAPVAAAEGETSPGCKDHPGTVLFPFFRAPNADLNMTIAMALIAVVTVQSLAIRAHGVGNYLKELVAPPIPGLHIIGELSRIISLSARLFGNIFGGEVLLAVIIALTLPFLFGVIGVIPAVFYGLEVFFGLIQATLFAMLTLIYITVATAGHDDHDTHHEHGVMGALENAAEDMAVGSRY
jgi:F-type H+-transporting ATPase subunit a